jgi:hypothetical protein
MMGHNSRLLDRLGKMFGVISSRRRQFTRQEVEDGFVGITDSTLSHVPCSDFDGGKTGPFNPPRSINILQTFNKLRAEITA